MNYSNLEEMKLGDLTSMRKDFSQRKKEIESGELKSIKTTLDELDRTITRKMQDIGLRQVQDASGKATFYLTDEIVPKVLDWDSVYPYVAKNGYWHLFYRKLTAKAFREIIEHGEEVPGTEAEVVTRLKMQST
ncbi:MAG: hypothetical protein GY880_03085 [Planctomycetaceae bacterium]|jgi:hypothetical protein|nr:hypothetical protein [Planctomycetaceae bacterium]